MIKAQLKERIRELEADIKNLEYRLLWQEPVYKVERGTCEMTGKCSRCGHDMTLRLTLTPPDGKPA